MPSLAKRYRHKRPGKIKIFGADDRNAKWACLESTLLLPTASVAGTAQVLIDRLPESIRKCTTHSPGRHPIPHMADASSQGMLSAFPFLTEPEFDHACAAFLDRVQALESLHVSGWSSVRLEKQTCGTVLKISRVIDSPTTLNREKATLEDTPESHESQADAFEDDPEALARTADPDPYFQVEYDILLSPTYQVPVLYFVLRGSRVGPVGIETVYQYLVPDQYKKEVKSVGVLGGISMGYHPESGTPAFFAHPCNTADAMRHIARGQDVHPELYLLLWLGLVGSRVSLHVPRELFANENK